MVGYGRRPLVGGSGHQAADGGSGRFIRIMDRGGVIAIAGFYKTTLRHPHEIEWNREWLRPGISGNNWGVETRVITVCQLPVELQVEISHSVANGRARGTGRSRPKVNEEYSV